MFPSSRTGYVQGLKWKKTKYEKSIGPTNRISSTTILVNSDSSRPFQFNPWDVKCAVTTEEFCHICTFQAAMIPMKVLSIARAAI